MKQSTIHPKTFLLVLLFFPSFLIRAQTADGVIKKYIGFSGGEKQWKRITTVVTSGEYNYGGVVFPFKTYNKAPNLYKFVVTFKGKYYAQAFDGRSGWKIDVFNGDSTPTLLTGKAALAMSNEAIAELEDVFINYKKKGHTVSLEGEDTVHGQLCWVIKLVLKTGETETYYFNQKTYEIMMKKTVSGNSEMGGAAVDIYYNDYRNVNNIKIPFKTVVRTKDQTLLSVTMNIAELNTAVADTEFQFHPPGNP